VKNNPSREALIVYNKKTGRATVLDITLRVMNWHLYALAIMNVFSARREESSTRSVMFYNNKKIWRAHIVDITLPA